MGGERSLRADHVTASALEVPRAFLNACRGRVARIARAAHGLGPFRQIVATFGGWPPSRVCLIDAEFMRLLTIRDPSMPWLVSRSWTHDGIERTLAALSGPVRGSRRARE
jgi:hypothetical protein